MSLFTKTYYLVPNCDYPPDGFITLGSIIPTPLTPGTSLNNNTPLPATIKPQTSIKTDWKATISNQKSGKIGLWTKFLELLGFGADLSVEYDNDEKEVYAFDTMETSFFDPPDDFVREAMKAEGVMRFVTAGRFRKPVYIITGMKIVRGAKVSSVREKGRGGNVKLGFDGLPLGVPVKAGPDAEIKAKTERSVGFGGSSDFVFAVRVSRVEYKKSNEVKTKDETRGALFSDEINAAKEKKIEVVGLEEGSAIVQGLGDNALGIVVDEDNDEECNCVLISN